MCAKKIRLYSWLSDHGFVPFKAVTDKYNPTRLVWLYPNGEDLQGCISEYYSLIPKVEK